VSAFPFDRWIFESSDLNTHSEVLMGFMKTLATVSIRPAFLLIIARSMEFPSDSVCSSCPSTIYALFSPKPHATSERNSNDMISLIGPFSLRLKSSAKRTQVESAYEDSIFNIFELSFLTFFPSHNRNFVMRKNVTVCGRDLTIFVTNGSHP
jgi:hypothetical protein